MSLVIRYNNLIVTGGVPDTITARMGVSFSASAEEGSVAQSQIVVDDTANTLNYVGLRRVYAYETAAPAHNQMVFNGYLQERRIGRDPAEGQDEDVEVHGRRWDLTVADTNSLLSRRLITGADGVRPAETDIARIQWLLDSNDAYLSNPKDTWENPSPYIDTSGPIDMDAADLRGQTAFDVLNDCAQRSGKNWFAQYYEANDTVPPSNTGSIAIHYYVPESTYYTSTLRLTNVNADADDVTTFYVLPDAILTRSPARTYSGVYLQYDGGELYEQSTTVENLFQRRDAAVSNPNVNTSAKATALATRYLADAETEDDRLTCRFIVAKQYVNDLREGQRFPGQFTHLPGYTASYTYWRCLRRAVTQLNDEFYQIAIEATPAPEPTTASIAQQYSYRSGTATGELNQFPAAVTAGNLLVLVVGHRNGGTGGLAFSIKRDNSTGPLRSFTQWGSFAEIRSADLAGSDAMGIYYRVATGDEQTLFLESTRLQWTMYEVQGAASNPAAFEVLSATLQASSGGKSLGSFTGAATGDLQIAGFIWDDDSAGTDQTVGAGWTQDQQRQDFTTDKHPATLQMHASTGPAVSISGGAYEWGGVAVNIKPA